MDAQLVELARNAIDAVKPVLPQILIGTAGSGLWDWIKARFSATSRAPMTVRIEDDPGNDALWAELSAALVSILAETPSLVEELKNKISDSQVDIGSGPNSKSIKVKGNDNVSIIN